MFHGKAVPVQKLPIEALWLQRASFGILQLLLPHWITMPLASPPPWLQEMANAVALYLQPWELFPPLGCHYVHVHDQWEVTLFAASTEMVGGRRDGARHPSRFNADLGGIQGIFSDVKRFEWQSLPVARDDELGAHVSLEGTYEGHAVWLRILAQAPDRFHSGRLVHIHDQVWEEIW